MWWPPPFRLVDSLLDMPLSQADRAALTQMLETQPDLDRWRLRAQTVEEPEIGSDLALDDKIYPHMAISQLARMSLVLSGEHLRLALDAVNAKQLYPSSHFTVLRGALVGASQGVWILSPDDRGERRERGLAVLAEMYSQMGKYYDSLDGLSQDDQEKLDDQKDWLSGRKAGWRHGRANKRGLPQSHRGHPSLGRERLRQRWPPRSGPSAMEGDECRRARPGLVGLSAVVVRTTRPTHWDRPRQGPGKPRTHCRGVPTLLSDAQARLVVVRPSLRATDRNMRTLARPRLSIRTCRP